MPYFYIDTHNKKIVVDSKKIKELIVNGIITAQTTIGSTDNPTTMLAGAMPKLAEAFVEFQRRVQIQRQAQSIQPPPVAVPPTPTTFAPVVPANTEAPSAFPVGIYENASVPMPAAPVNIETPPAPTQSADAALMMAMMKELINARSQPQSQPQIVITNTNTNTNANTGYGHKSYSIIMGFVVWLFFGWCMGGSYNLGRCSSLVLLIALLVAVATIGIAGILFYIIDFLIVLLTAFSKPGTDCHGRRAIYT